MLQPAHRLRRADDLTRVRQQGRAWRHPLVILLISRNGLQQSRFAFVASRRVGNAVVRNRAKRLLRESVRLSLDQIDTGWDCVFIARPLIVGESFGNVQTAVNQLLQQAEILIDGISDFEER